MIDEIHVRAMANIHLNYGTFGLDHNDPKRSAKTVFGFMIKSIFGRYQEIISLIPSFNETAKTLTDLTVDNLELVNELGGKIFAIITDNNRVNVKLFKSFGISAYSPYRFFQNPANQEKLFAFFDSVHLLKNSETIGTIKKTLRKQLNFMIWWELTELNGSQNLVI